MANTLYFYDLETSGINPRSARIMQFAGQRTTLELEPIGEPDNILVKLTPDILPEPDAVLITGITPQQTLADGTTQAEFLKYFNENIVQPNTTFMGYNTVRFDDEFMRFANYQCFYDPYEMHYKDGCSRWDLLDVVRMTRALRPDGIQWPFAPDGKPSNRLELLTSVNKLDHYSAHDALSDVYATIAVAKLIRTKQPKLFDYLYKLRDKREVEKLVVSHQPFVYTSGRYSAEHEKTTISVMVSSHPTQKGSAFVYDLRYDPTPFKDMKPAELAELISNYGHKEDELKLPVKQIQYNKCPAVAPLAVLTAKNKESLAINDALINTNFEKLRNISDFGDRLLEAIRLREKQRQTTFIVDVNDVDSQLYDGFFNDADKSKMRTIRLSDENKLADLHFDFDDNRLAKLLLLYKARQYPKSLTAEEQEQWEQYRTDKLLGAGEESRMAKYFARIAELEKQPNLTDSQRYLLDELKLYGQSIMPYDN